MDLCILLGCDYVDKIRGIGPKKAIELVRKHGSIEEILKHLDTTKYPPPENWMFSEARRLFNTPDVTPAAEVELKWDKPDEEGLVAYMCGEKGFQVWGSRSRADFVAQYSQTGLIFVLVWSE